MFLELPVNEMSKLKRRLVCGVGVNDATYVVQPMVKGTRLRCPFYMKWTAMLRRCYNSGFQEKQDTYKGCTVCSDWLTFSNFKIWMEKQDWQGKELDKDVLNQHNKVYSPETCIFVSKLINLLLGGTKSKKGGAHPQGVSFYESTNKFRAQLSVDGKRTFLGYFDTPELAFLEYKKEKYARIHAIARLQPEPIKSALMAYKIYEK